MSFTTKSDVFGTKRNVKIASLTYANGLTEEYVYNALEFLTEIWYTVNQGNSSNSGQLQSTVKEFKITQDVTSKSLNVNDWGRETIRYNNTLIEYRYKVLTEFIINIGTYFKK